MAQIDQLKKIIIQIKGFFYEGEAGNLYPLNMYIVCGDHHWQYVSKHRKYGIVEFSIGPNSMEHAGGLETDNVKPEHLY